MQWVGTGNNRAGSERNREQAGGDGAGEFQRHIMRPDPIPILSLLSSPLHNSAPEKWRHMRPIQAVEATFLCTAQTY